MRTKIELTLEQTQQGVSDEVLAETGSIHMLSEILKLLSCIEDSHHGPSDAMHNPPQPLKVILMVIAAGRDKSRFIATSSNSNDILLKLKNFKKDGYLSFQDQEKYEHVGPKVTSTQEGKRSRVNDKKLCLVDDLKMLKDHMQVKLNGTSSSLKSKITTTNHKLKIEV
ncbi:hypothetical protein Tco_0808632 [Tanacetum coccineum]